MKSKIVFPIACSISLALFSTAISLKAVPYASGLTNQAGSVSFRLNENADSVSVISSAGGGATNDLGPLPPGLVTTNLGISGPYSVIVRKSVPGTWTQTSSDTNNFVKFNSPRGVTVNRNPASPWFGRIYVSNSGAGTTAGRPVGDGIYLLNSDQSDALGRGDTASTAGIDFAAGGASDPWKIGVGEDDLLYINDFSTAAANTYATDPDVTTSTQLLDGVGENTNPGVHTDSASTPIAKGSLTNGNLTLYNIEGAAPGAFNSIARWDIGAGPVPFAGAPTLFGSAGISSVADLNTDLELGNDGKFYTSINRSAGTDTDSVRVFDTDGFTILWGSLTVGGSPDPLRQTRAISLSPDQKSLALIRDNNNVFVLKLNNGIPDLSTLTVISNAPNTTIGRDIAYDIAGNIYTVGSGQGLLRVFSPGGTTIATTTSDGSFSLTSPIADVSVTASTATASEEGTVPGEFIISRSGETNGVLTVFYTLSGTATNGTDYTALPGSVTFVSGQSSTNIVVTPVDDSAVEPVETVILTISGRPEYSPAPPSVATVSIVDNEAPAVSIIALQTNVFERMTNDYVTFQLNRIGSTNADLTVDLAYSGSATADTDFVGPTNVVIAAGSTEQTFTLSPLEDQTVEGTESIVVTVQPGAGYGAGSPASATARILDAQLPPERVLYSDTLENDTSTNWVLRFAANNQIDDYIMQFGYDLATDFIPPAPGGRNTALKISVNKSDSSDFGAAGLNLYLTNHVFSGDYAVRFSMYLLQNTSAGTTEHATFGINHSGEKTNWVRQSTGNVGLPAVDDDGLWYAVVVDGSEVNGLSHVLYTGTNAASPATILSNRLASTLTSEFKSPPFSGAGSPGNAWVDVEITQISNVVTLKINQTPIIQVTNTTPYTAGEIMLGYNDQFDSIGNVGSVYYSNLRVDDLSAIAPPTKPIITGIRQNGSNMEIDFTGETNDTASAFTLVQSPVLESPMNWTDAPATITGSAPQFQAVTPFVPGTNRFYKVRRN